MSSKLTRVIRLDSMPLFRASFTSEGYLEDRPVLTTCGIFEYTDTSGNVRRELRLPEEVFKDESLASYKGKPIIITHDAGMITKDNVAEEQIGTILSEGYRSGNDVRAEIIIHDTDDMRDSGLKELSLGYTLDLDETPGEWNGEHYDAIQRNILINHLALVKEARAGDQARLNIDSRNSQTKILTGGKVMKKYKKADRADGLLSPDELQQAIAEYMSRRSAEKTDEDKKEETPIPEKPAPVPAAKAPAAKAPAAPAPAVSASAPVAKAPDAKAPAAKALETPKQEPVKTDEDPIPAVKTPDGKSPADKSPADKSSAVNSAADNTPAVPAPASKPEAKTPAAPAPKPNVPAKPVVPAPIEEKKDADNVPEEPAPEADKPSLDAPLDDKIGYVNDCRNTDGDIDKELLYNIIDTLLAERDFNKTVEAEKKDDENELEESSEDEELLPEVNSDSDDDAIPYTDEEENDEELDDVISQTAADSDDDIDDENDEDIPESDYDTLEEDSNDAPIPFKTEDEAVAEDKNIRSDDIESIVQARLDVALIGRSINLDGLEKLPVITAKKKIIAHVRPDMRLDGKSDDYVNGVYALAVKEIRSRKNSGTEKQKARMFNKARNNKANFDGADYDDISSKDAREKMIERQMRKHNKED